jgi:hypothetical protein
VLSKEREDVSKEDETIVNHFHGVSSSSKPGEMCVDTDVCGRTEAQERLPEEVFQPDLFECKKYITSLEKQFQGKPCIGLQLDMWTNTDSVEGEQNSMPVSS